MYDIINYLNAAAEYNASDLLITSGAQPTCRINGELRPIADNYLDGETTKQLLYTLLEEWQIKHFEEKWELDFAITIEEAHRFRGNLYLQRGAPAGAFRLIPNVIPRMENLNLPHIIEDIALKPQGLVLVTGPTGHGKSTTQAAMINLINNTKAAHIITIEEPIEFLHQNVKSIIDQRDVGFDTKSYHIALKHVLRQDPDVILIGELRDQESVSTALTAAETGHLVFGTLHTNDAVQSIDRIIDVFPPHQQSQVRMQLSTSLLAIVSQRLLPNISRDGRVCATEVLINNSAVSNLIRENKNAQIPAIIETQSQLGMHTMDSSLKDLYYSNEIEFETARAYMKNPASLNR